MQGHIRIFFSVINKAYPSTFKTVGELNAGFPRVFKRMREKVKRSQGRSNPQSTKSTEKDVVEDNGEMSGDDDETNDTTLIPETLDTNLAE